MGEQQRRYACMPRPRIVQGSLSIEALQPCHIEAVREWRNAQMDVLRQSVIITPAQQEAYYARHIWPEMPLPQPRNILLAYKENDELIGYGGLVHIAWEHRRAEVSFLLETDLAKKAVSHDYYFPIFLSIMKVLGFEDLGLDRLCTETYAIRMPYIAALERAGFQREGVLKQHVRIRGKPVDSILHGCVHSSAGAILKKTCGNVLVSSASTKVPLVQAVQTAACKLHPTIKVFAGDLNEHVLTRHVADDFWHMPCISERALHQLLKGCVERGICTIVPTRDGELLFWARHREEFARAGIDVLVPSEQSVHTCLDKLAFAAFGREKGLPFIAAALQPDEVGEGPYVVKERYGAGAQSMGIKLDREAALKHGALLKNPIYQPFVDGTEISIDSWLDRSGKVKGLVLRTRDWVVDGESQVTTTFRDNDIEAAAIDILHTLGVTGSVVMQALVDLEDRLHVIECNTRFGGASTASIAAGLDPFYWGLLESRGGDLTDYPFCRVPGEVRQVRVPNDFYIHGSSF